MIVKWSAISWSDTNFWVQTGFFGQLPDVSVFRTCSDLSIFSNFSAETRWIPLLLFTQFKNVNNVRQRDFWLDFARRKQTVPFPWWHIGFGIILVMFGGRYCLEVPCPLAVTCLYVCQLSCCCYYRECWWIRLLKWVSLCYCTTDEPSGSQSNMASQTCAPEDGWMEMSVWTRKLKAAHVHLDD